MKKYAKKQSAPFGKLLKGALLFETVLAAGAYYVWYKMSNHQDFRYRMYSKYPRILNGFYGILDKFGGSSPRLGDYEKWGIEQNTPRGEESQE